jgi:CelD/BcsL family acetyltransferase involved in cellulose biosynthesis
MGPRFSHLEVSRTRVGESKIPASVASARNSPRVPIHGPARRPMSVDLPVAETGAAATIEIIRTSDGLALLQPEWNDLYLRSTSRNPFLSYAWTDACWAGPQGHAELFVVTLRQFGELVGIAALCIEKRSGFRLLRFVADDRSDYLGFLCAPEIAGLEHILLDHVLSLSGEWDLALLRQLADSYTSLHNGLLPSAFQWHRTEWTRAPYCKVDGDLESFHKSGPSWLREMRKRSRRFTREGHRSECFKGPEAIARLDDVSEIEAHSWKGRERTTRLQPGPGRELLRRALETLGARGELELWLAFVDERAVAFQIDFVHQDRVWHYQCAYDERFRDTRAGSILTYQALLNAWERGVREFDYLSGEEPYKLERTNASRAIHHLAAHGRSPRGWLAYGLLIAPRWRLRHVRALRAIYQVALTAKRRLRTQSNA